MERRVRSMVTDMTRVVIGAVFTATAWAQFPAFEVASVRLHRVAVDAPVFKNPDVNPVHISGTRVDLQMISLTGLVMAAYHVKEYQVAEVPKWASGPDQIFDIAAKTPGSTAPSMAQVRSMLQTLLADRFHLKLRHESKRLPVYNLVAAKNGPKLKRVSDDTPPAPGMRRGSIDQLAALLSLMLDRPVIDKTGLAETYDYRGNLALLDTGAADSADVIAKTLTAIQEQLGLKADPATATLEMLAIESAEKPSEN